MGAKKLKTILKDYYAREVVLMSDKWFPTTTIAKEDLTAEEMEIELASSSWRASGQRILVSLPYWQKKLAEISYSIVEEDKDVDSKA